MFDNSGAWNFRKSFEFTIFKLKITSLHSSVRFNLQTGWNSTGENAGNVEIRYNTYGDVTRVLLDCLMINSIVVEHMFLFTSHICDDSPVSGSTWFLIWSLFTIEYELYVNSDTWKRCSESELRLFEQLQKCRGERLNWKLRVKFRMKN